MKAEGLGWGVGGWGLGGGGVEFLRHCGQVSESPPSTANTQFLTKHSSTFHTQLIDKRTLAALTSTRAVQRVVACPDGNG